MIVSSEGLVKSVAHQPIGMDVLLLRSWSETLPFTFSSVFNWQSYRSTCNASVFFLSEMSQSISEKQFPVQNWFQKQGMNTHARSCDTHVYGAGWVSYRALPQ